MLPSISFRVVENQDVLGHLCQVALVYIGSRFSGFKLCKRGDDGLYFLMQKRYSHWGTGAFYYELVDNSYTQDKSKALEVVKQKVGI